MRLIIRPVTMSSPKTIQGDSNYLGMVDFCKWVSKIKDGKCFFNFLMPLKYRGCMEDTELIKHYFFPILYYDWHYTQAYVPPELGAMVNRRFGKGPIADGYLCESSAANCGVDNVTSALRRRVPIFVRETGVPYPGYIHDTVREEMYRDRGIGYYYSKANFFNSELEKKMAIKLMSRYLKASSLGDVVDRCHVIHRGINKDSLDISKPCDKFKKFTVMYGGRWNSVKNFERYFEIMSKAKLLIKDMDVLAMSQQQFPKDIKDKYTMINFYERIGAKQYREMLKKSHVFFNTSLHESYSVATVEAIATNTISIFPERTWVTEGMYKDADYIFKLSDHKEAISMLKHIKNNYAVEYKKFDKYRKSFMKGHDRAKSMETMLNIIEKSIEDDVIYFDVDKPRLESTIKSFLEEGQDKVSLEQIHRRFFGTALSAVDDIGCPRNFLIYPGRRDFAYCMQKYGLGEDTYGQPDIWFKLNESYDF